MSGRLAVALLAAGCVSPGAVGEIADGSARDGGADAAITPGLVALRVEPASMTLVDDGVLPGAAGSFRALGTFADGEERDLSASVAWRLEDATLGAVDQGEIVTAGVGGRTAVVAAANGLEASGALTVRLEVTVVGPGAPADAPARFAADPAGDVEDGAVRLVYPSDGTMFPRNLDRLTHQWIADGALDLFELRLDSDVATLRFYTADRQLLTEGAAWRWLADSHAGGSVDAVVRGVDDEVPTEIHRSRTITELFSASEVNGALFYWSTGAQGVMRAHVSSPSAELFYEDAAPGDRECVSCHTVSRDGRRLAVAYGGEHLRQITVPARELTIPADPTEEGPAYGWGTFNPGATRLLYANRGALTLLDAETGATVRTFDLGPDVYATHPDWSPDGRWVTVALSARRPSNKQVKGSSLARLPVVGDDLGAPEVLVASANDDDTIYFPSYSPDSRWIAFARGVGDSKDNATGQLFLVRADGSSAPVSLTLLNQRVRDQDGVVDIGNSMPTWAPSTTPDVFWIAFSSVRDYGWVLEGVERDQLWGAAIDPARAALGDDPSFAAFWMPFQQLDEGNHRAFWALAGEDICPSTIELCDGLDNDCDGIVDEMCCAPSPEVCADGLDNDCDGVIDDGCGCSDTEDCANMLDDDCDGLVDLADEDCVIF